MGKLSHSSELALRDLQRLITQFLTVFMLKEIPSLFLRLLFDLLSALQNFTIKFQTSLSSINSSSTKIHGFICCFHSYSVILNITPRPPPPPGKIRMLAWINWFKSFLPGTADLSCLLFSVEKVISYPLFRIILL